MNQKQIKTNLLLLVLFGISIQVMGQRIRKDHREMTPSEKTLYVQALLQNRAYFENEGLHHQCHFSQTNSICPIPLENVHNNELFLPWHRIFQYHAETVLRTSVGSVNLSIPYWDWRVEPTPALSTWEEPSFLGQFDDPTSTIWRYLQRSWQLGNLNTSNPVIPSTVLGRVNNALNSSAFGGFQSGIENTVHAAGHQEVGGEMSSPNSPWDPVFYLHHGMVDKLWQEWEDKITGDQSDFSERNTTGDYDIPPDVVLDSRFLQNIPGLGQDVWYAYNKKLLLDGSGYLGSASNFTPNTNKLYCYTAWNGSNVEGTIYAGDVKRDASDNIVADDKGGFQIPSGKTVDFRAGKAIYLMGGFKTVQGAAFSAKCVTTPCGFSSNTLVSPGTPELSALDIPKNTEVKAKIQIIPNPIGDALNVQYEVENEGLVQIHVFNVLGQVVAQYQPGIQVPGKYSYSVSTQDWSKGIYNCRVSIGKESTSVKAVH